MTNTANTQSAFALSLTKQLDKAFEEVEKMGHHFKQYNRESRKAMEELEAIGDKEGLEAAAVNNVNYRKVRQAFVDAKAQLSASAGEFHQALSAAYARSRGFAVDTKYQVLVLGDYELVIKSREGSKRNEEGEWVKNGTYYESGMQIHKVSLRDSQPSSKEVEVKEEELEGLF